MIVAEPRQGQKTIPIELLEFIIVEPLFGARLLRAVAVKACIDGVCHRIDVEATAQEEVDLGGNRLGLRDHFVVFYRLMEVWGCLVGAAGPNRVSQLEDILRC
jgi:hypothetical protein